jgi:hypothetical protein
VLIPMARKDGYRDGASRSSSWRSLASGLRTECVHHEHHDPRTTRSGQLGFREQSESPSCTSITVHPSLILGKIDAFHLNGNNRVVRERAHVSSLSPRRNGKVLRYRQFDSFEVAPDAP